MDREYFYYLLKCDDDYLKHYAVCLRFLIAPLYDHIQYAVLICSFFPKQTQVNMNKKHLTKENYIIVIHKIVQNEKGASCQLLQLFVWSCSYIIIYDVYHEN